ncbi:MAG TPA: type II secretion system protein GspC [Steroidobacteraceae bacterium]|nr:type II secretion system protein GspC [Steroidobacteraceae bacterium]
MNAASWLEDLPAPDRWRALLLRDGPRLATWMAALALGVQAAFVVTDLAGAGRRPPAAAAAAATRVQPTDIAAITNAHLFGAAPAPKQSDANAPRTSMPLTLTGIIAANDPQNGLAILGPNAQTAKVYAVGDTVPGGARLHSVYVDRVVIDRAGQLESLVLPKEVHSAPPPSSTALPTASPVVERMRRALTEQPGLIADLLRPQAVMEGDKVKGFRVYPGRNRFAFYRLGLRPGDEVVAINGTPLDDRDRGQEILSTLGGSSEAHVTVIRAGRSQELTLNLAQVAQEAEVATGLDSTAPRAPGVPPATGGMPATAAPAEPPPPAPLQAPPPASLQSPEAPPPEPPATPPGTQ